MVLFIFLTHFIHLFTKDGETYLPQVFREMFEPFIVG
jgi:hypothetical protein